MRTANATPDIVNGEQSQPDRSLAPAITWAASKQSYYTVRLLVDRDRVDDAYRAYAYFRWVDDQLDQGGLDSGERLAFVERQKALVEGCYRGERPERLTNEEGLLVALLRDADGSSSGLQAYVRNMMAVMAFDAARRGHLITEAELGQYTRWLATAVTEALHYFIGHRCGSPQSEARYLAAAGAHVTHMLRDTLEDVEAGYFNIPREYVETHGIDPCDMSSDAYRAWVKSRVGLARYYFGEGHAYLTRVENPRCRLAGYAYMARFDGVLDAIERDGYRLRAAYPECKTLGAGLRMGWSVVSQALLQRRATLPAHALAARQG